MGGPAAFADFKRITESAPAALTLSDGKFLWARIDGAPAKYRSVDGEELNAELYSPFDIMSLATILELKSIRMDLAYSVSASRRRGDPFSTEIVIEITGRRKSGEPGSVRHEIVHPQGQAPLTALCVALAAERMLGLAGGQAPTPGLYFPELLLEPAHVVAQMKTHGARFATTSPRPLS